MNKKRYKILNKCADKLFEVINEVGYGKLSSSDFYAILQICKYFTSRPNEDEIFVDNKNIADWFREVGGFSIEEELSQYHIFIEDKDNEVSDNKQFA